MGGEGAHRKAREYRQFAFRGYELRGSDITSGKSDPAVRFSGEMGVDLQSEHERYLTEELVKKPLFLIDYPREIKAFYMKVNDDERTVAAMDLLVPLIGEIIGGSQREDRLEVLDRQMDAFGLNKDTYWWYRDLRRFGGVPMQGLVSDSKER